MSSMKKITGFKKRIRCIHCKKFNDVKNLNSKFCCDKCATEKGIKRRNQNQTKPEKKRVNFSNEQ